MTLESQVCSLDLAKRLKELGVKQESLFWWIADILVFKTQTGFYNIIGAGMNLHPLADHAISAFTVAELGEMLPIWCETYKTEKGTVAFSKGMWKVRCYPPVSGAKNHSEYADTEADARAKMLIYLLENKLITV